MGDNVRQGVTDHCGRVFDAGWAEPPIGITMGSFVLDGSIVPTSLGINPSLTISVLALRAITRLKADWKLRDGKRPLLWTKADLCDPRSRKTQKPHLSN